MFLGWDWVVWGRNPLHAGAKSVEAVWAYLGRVKRTLGSAVDQHCFGKQTALSNNLTWNHLIAFLFLFLCDFCSIMNYDLFVVPNQIKIIRLWLAYFFVTKSSKFICCDVSDVYIICQNFCVNWHFLSSKASKSLSLLHLPTYKSTA